MLCGKRGCARGTCQIEATYFFQKAGQRLELTFLIVSMAWRLCLSKGSNSANLIKKMRVPRPHAFCMYKLRRHTYKCVLTWLRPVRLSPNFVINTEGRPLYKQRDIVIKDVRSRTCKESRYCVAQSDTKISNHLSDHHRGLKSKGQLQKLDFLLVVSNS